MDRRGEPKFDWVDYLFWCGSIILFFGLLLFYLSGCASEQMTQEQWVERFKPENIEQAEAMAVLQSSLIGAKAKADSLAVMDKVKIACALGAMAAFFGVGMIDGAACMHMCAVLV